MDPATLDGGRWSCRSRATTHGCALCGCWSVVCEAGDVFGILDGSGRIVASRLRKIRIKACPLCCSIAACDISVAPHEARHVLLRNIHGSELRFISGSLQTGGPLLPWNPRNSGSLVSFRGRVPSSEHCAGIASYWFALRAILMLTLSVETFSRM